MEDTMSLISSLKISSQPRTVQVKSTKERLRDKLIAGLREQADIFKADGNGQVIALTRKQQVTDPETKVRSSVDVPKRVRRWFWHNSGGVWFLELRYGNRVIVLDQKSKSGTIEVGKKDDLLPLIEKLIAATQSGELDGPLTAMASIQKKKDK